MQLRELLQTKGIPVDRLEYLLMQYSQNFEVANHYESPELYVEHITALDAVADFLKILNYEPTETELPESSGGAGEPEAITPDR
jgi:hypothetical protein